MDSGDVELVDLRVEVLRLRQELDKMIKTQAALMIKLGELGVPVVRMTQADLDALPLLPPPDDSGAFVVGAVFKAEKDPNRKSGFGCKFMVKKNVALRTSVEWYEVIIVE
jgi:hypothetical protein